VSSLRRIRRLPPLIAALALAALVAACGVKGAPEPPAGDKAAYPRSYPQSNRYPQRAEEEPQRIDPATGEPLDRQDVETVEEEEDDI
jgi:predicted small lipoprotein YifL